MYIVWRFPITNVFLICMCSQSLERGNKEWMNEKGLIAQK